MELKELKTKEEMLLHLDVLQALYPNLNALDYEKELSFMLQHNYGQVAVFDEQKCVGISGYWIGNKLWCGKYLEMDNVIVLESHRSKGVGKLMSDYLNQKALDEGCTMLALDAYTTNFKAHRFYYNQGFAPKGFHFIKVLNADKIR